MEQRVIACSQTQTGQYTVQSTYLNIYTTIDTELFLKIIENKFYLNIIKNVRIDFIVFFRVITGNVDVAMFVMLL